MAHLIIVANDDAFGTVQLSAPIVRVAENHVGPIINVTRLGGAFADVSVKFKAVPMTAVAGKRRWGEGTGVTCVCEQQCLKDVIR